jgi:two-component system sensor histidine kinase ResE
VLVGQDFRYSDADGVRVMHADTIPNTPWVVAVTTPTRLIDARARAFLGRATTFGLLLVVLGAGIAWLISRRLTRPLVQLESAAASMSNGAYAQRVAIVRDDEIGSLGHAFNVMADRVQHSHAELEERYETAQALATELELAPRTLTAARRSARATVRNSSTRRAQACRCAPGWITWWSSASSRPERATRPSAGA